MASGNKPKGIEILPMRVSNFDSMIDIGGLERGSTIILSGNPGVGKTVFALQSAYNSAIAGEKVVYITLDESPEKLKKHVNASFGWDFDKLEEKGNFAFQKIDPLDVTNTIKSIIGRRDIGELIKNINKPTDLSPYTQFASSKKDIVMPFKPDRLVIDSLAPILATLSDRDNYRIYLKALFESLQGYDSINLIINEASKASSGTYSMSPEDYMADGVVFFYNIRKEWTRTRALEILKLRFSKHLQKLVPFNITKDGIAIFPSENVF